MSALAPLTRAQLVDVRAALAQRIRAGLCRDGAEVRALPAFLAPPHRGVAGRALTVDTGGTNMRAAVVEIDAEGSARILHGPNQVRVPTGRDGTYVDARMFFAAHAALVSSLPADAVRGLPIGYCFSYPSVSTSNHDARLLRWTKGVDVAGAVGSLVGRALTDALQEAGLSPGPVVVLNDTVAALLAVPPGASTTRPTAHAIGLIVGTGTNMATYFDGHRIEKLAAAPGAPGVASWLGPMAVNLESGNFHPPHLSPCDDAVDAASDNIGAQRFEKAVSGHYLPLVARALDARDPPADGVALVARAQAGDALCRAVLDRSADLVAAALAGAADVAAPGSPPGHEFAVLAEGGLFWSPSGYAERVGATLAALDMPMQIVRRADANLCGAAMAALTARG